MCVLEVKSTARKPTRSIVGAIATMSAVVSPVALQRLWLPSRVVVSTISTTPLTVGLHPEERRAVLDHLRVRGADLDDRPGDAGGDRVHHLHHLDEADDRRRARPSPRRRRTASRPAPGRGRRRRASARRSDAAPSRRRLLGGGSGLPARRSPRTHVEREPVRLDAQLARSDSSISRRISRTSSSSSAIRTSASLVLRSAPNVPSTSDRADPESFGARSGDGRHRPRLEHEQRIGSRRRARSPTRCPGASRSGARRAARARPARSAAPRRGTAPSRRSSGTSTRTVPRPAASGTYSTSLAFDRAAHDLARDLADQVVVGRHLAADDRDARAPSSR